LKTYPRSFSDWLTGPVAATDNQELTAAVVMVSPFLAVWLLQNHQKH
jgi:hypothetical protein